MPNYQEGKIYKIISSQTDRIYIGSTTQKLSSRFSNHNVDYKSWQNNCCHYMSSYEIIQYLDAEIILLEDFPCYTAEELVAKEDEYIIKFKDICINKYRAKRNQKQYYEENKEEILEKNRQYREGHREEVRFAQKKYDTEHKEERKNYQEKYRGEHREESKQYFKEYNEVRRDYRMEYYKKNKEEISRKKKEQLHCDICNSLVSRHYMTTHKKKSSYCINFAKENSLICIARFPLKK